MIDADEDVEAFRLRARDVGPTAWLGQQLHPDRLALEDRRDEALLLFFGAELEEHGETRRHRRHLQPRRMLEAGELLVERALVGWRQSLAAVVARHAEAREARVEQLALHGAVAGDVRELHLVGGGLERPDQALGIGGPEVGADPRPSSPSEGLDVFGVVFRHAGSVSSTMSAMRCR